MQSGTHRKYENITSGTISKLVSELAARGVRVTGTNPWDIYADKVGVQLRVVWARENSTLAVSIMKKKWYISQDLVWSKLDALLQKEAARANKHQGGSIPAST